MIHGVIAEVEEIDRTREFIYYRVLLVPPAFRMRWRRRCRTFAGNTLREIVSSVLENRPYPGGPPAAGLGHFEFPAKDERMADEIGVHQARIRSERFEVERHLRQGQSTVRTLLPGHTVNVQDGDGLRNDEELLIARVETFATALGVEGTVLEHEPFGPSDAGQTIFAYENRFDALSAKTPFRPERRSPRPKIWGVQVARVWGPSADGEAPGQGGEPVDIYCDKLGRVQIKLPWDTRDLKDGKPPSDWCRVAHPWAGRAYGSMAVPRVGHEVLVAYEDGDPDRPVIVGSVYNPVESPPPYETESDLDKSRTTLKSKSTKVRSAEDGFNELRFTDLKKEEEIYLHAQRNLNEVVLADHSTTVGGNQSNTVGGNQSNTVYQNRTHDVTGTETVHVHGDRATTFDSNETHKVASNRSTTIGAVESLEVNSSRYVLVHGPDMAVVDSDDVTEVRGVRTVQVTGDHNVHTDASYHSTANANHTMRSTNMYITQAGEFQVNATSLWLNVGGASLKMEPGSISLEVGGASLTMAAGFVCLDNGAGSMLTLAGGSTFIVCDTMLASSGGATYLVARGDIHGSASNIHLNG